MRALLISVGFLAALAPGLVLAEPPDIAFDQAQRIYILDTSGAPPVGSFEDFRNSFETLAPSTTYPPLPGVIPAMPGAGGIIAGAARLKDGVVYRYSFLGTSVRVDDIPAQKSTIGRPDKGEVEYLDLKAKTYATIGGDAAKALLAPSVVAQVKALLPTPPDGTPHGTVSFKITGAQTTVADRDFGGIATKGLDYTLSMASGSTTSTCPSVTASAESITYVDPSRDERFKVTETDGDPRDMIRAMQSGGGCVASFEGTIPPRGPLYKKMYLYTRSRFSFTIAALPTPVDVVTIVERGNIAPLAAHDASLFEIPAGFTPTSAPNSPSPATPGPTK